MTLFGVLIAVLGFGAGMLTMHLYLQHQSMKPRPIETPRLHVVIPMKTNSRIDRELQRQLAERYDRRA